MKEYLISAFQIIPEPNLVVSFVYEKYKLYSIYIIPIITIVGMVFKYLSLRNLSYSMTNSAVNLISEYYFLEDIILHIDVEKYPDEMRNVTYLTLAKIISKRKTISIDDEKIVKHIFEKHDKDIDAIRMYFRTKYVVIGNNKITYKKCHKPLTWNGYFYIQNILSGLYFLLALIAISPNFLGFFIEGNITPFQFIFVQISFLVFFLGLAFCILNKYLHFYWANKLFKKLSQKVT